MRDYFAHIFHDSLGMNSYDVHSGRCRSKTGSSDSVVSQRGCCWGSYSAYQKQKEIKSMEFGYEVAVKWNSVNQAGMFQFAKVHIVSPS